MTPMHEIQILARWCRSPEVIAKETGEDINFIRAKLAQLRIVSVPHHPFDEKRNQERRA